MTGRFHATWRHLHHPQQWQSCVVRGVGRCPNRVAGFVGETVTAGGTVTAYDEASGEVTLEVFVKNDRDEVLTPGVITAKLDQER